ncbi:MAG: phage tail protein [Alphaproteobacteria bacterium]
MPFDLSVERDLKSLRRGLRALEKEVVPQATVRTLNRVAESAKTASARHIAPQMGSRQAGIKRRIETRRASVRRLWATLVASDRPLHLIEFVVGSRKPTQQPGGKRGQVKAKAWGKTKTYRGAFIAPRKKGSSSTEV